MMLRLLNRLGILKVVYLKDRDDQIYTTWVNKKLSRMTQAFFGCDACHVRPFVKVGQVVLNKDGTTSGSSHYIKFWRPM